MSWIYGDSKYRYYIWYNGNLKYDLRILWFSIEKSNRFYNNYPPFFIYFNNNGSPETNIIFFTYMLLWISALSDMIIEIFLSLGLTFTYIVYDFHSFFN